MGLPGQRRDAWACGDAIDVPEIVAAPLPVPLPVETMLTPGAVTSGFRTLSPLRGPPDEKSAKPLKLVFVSPLARSLPGPVRRAQLAAV